jgi:hypothetical protein
MSFRGSRWLVSFVGLVALGIVGGLALADGFDSASPNSGLAGNAAALQRVNDVQQAAREAHPQWWIHNSLPPISSWKKWTTRPRPRDGIFETSTPYPSEFYDMEGKEWQHWSSGWSTTVQAGAFAKDEKQGIVIVQEEPYPLRISLVPRRGALDAPDRGRTTLYRSPVRLGKLSLVGAHGDVLTLASAVGHRRISFDVSTRRFHER